MDEDIETLRILAADDDPAVATAIESALRAAGHTAVVTGDGVEALEWLAHDRIDGVVVDAQMPAWTAWSSAGDCALAGSTFRL